MKKYIYATIVVILLFLIGWGYTYYSLYNSLNSDYNIAKSNEKYYLLLNDSLQNKNRALTLTIDQLEAASDKSIAELNKARKDLKIKDNQIKALQNIKTEAVKRDTLILKDTIFIKEDFKLDTLLGDKWCSLQLTLEYPNNIEYGIEYSNDLNIAVYSEKETIDPPKKCWISRLFQKKHTVTKIEVEDKNPYSKIKEQTFVIIE